MNRRNFLKLIPAVALLPIVAKNDTCNDKVDRFFNLSDSEILMPQHVRDYIYTCDTPMPVGWTVSIDGIISGSKTVDMLI